MRKTPLLTVVYLLLTFCTYAQMVGTNVFLQGRFVEIGILKNGAHGACTGTPAGYHPNSTISSSPNALAEVYDIGHDGWTTGTPVSMGDYTLPGSPFEGWSIQAAGARANAYQNCTGTIYNTAGMALTGSNVGYSNTGGSARAYWQGSSLGGQLQIDMETRVDTNASWVLMKVKMRNTGTAPIPDVYYMRSCEPNIDYAWGGGYANPNTVIYQNDTASRVLIQAQGTIYSSATMGLGTRDSRAKAITYSSWPMSISIDLASVYHSMPAVVPPPGTVTVGGNAIGLLYDLGTIAPGDSAQISYAYIFNGTADFDSIFTLPPCTGTPSIGMLTASTATACSTTLVTLGIPYYSMASGLAFQWQSSPDSAAWTDIPGATSSSWSFSGLTATTFYRVRVTCTSTASTAYSAGKKINYTAVCDCSVFFSAGAATASTSICSSCYISLDLASASLTPDLAYQWERSLNGTTGWANIPSATSVPYVHMPVNTYYYRCKMTCPASGATLYSTPVFVIQPPHIVQDSVTQSPATLCSGQKYYIKASTASPLYRLKTYFGDGATATDTLTTSGTASYASVPHYYSLPGTYTVKQVLCVDTFRVDSVTFTYNHLHCNSLLVKFYHEANGNCIKDPEENYIYTPVSVRVDSSGIPIDTIVCTSGIYYNATGPVGTTYSFSVISAYLSAVCPTSAIVSITITAGTFVYPEHQIGLVASLAPYDMAIYSSAIFGSTASKTTLLPVNYGSVAVPANINVIMSPKITSLSVAGTVLPGSVVTGSSAISWTVAPINNMSVTPLLYVNAHSIPLPMGDTVHSVNYISPTSADIDTTNNTIIREDTVKASYDPNIIAVSPRCFDNDTSLQFTVHFENLGNDTAHNVYVMDTLSDNLDAKSMEMLASSAVMNLYQYTAGPYNIVKFNFPDIKLLDSSWRGLNDGMFVFKVKTKTGMITGDAVLSRVGIYFDDNEVVMTNTAGSVKGCPIIETTNTRRIGNNNTIMLYPNPATEELTIEADAEIFTSCSITNTVGQEMINQSILHSQIKVNVSKLPAGVYYVNLRGEQANEVCKFVKW